MEKSMRKQIILRNIRYWGGWTEKTFLLILGIGILYSMLMPFLFDEEMSGLQQFAMTAVYVVAMEFMMLFVMPITAATFYLPLGLAFGSGRREALRGLQFANLLVGIQILLLFVILEKIGCSMTESLGREFSQCAGWYAAIVGGVILFAMAYGQVGTALTMKYGGKGMAVYIIGFILLLFVATFFIVFAVGRGIVENSEILPMIVSADIMQLVKSSACLLLAVAAVLYAIGNCVLMRGILRCEVRI